MKFRIFELFRYLLLGLFMLTAVLSKADIPDTKISFSRESGTVYDLLMRISDKTGYRFIYDSRIVDNDKKAKINKGTYTVREAVVSITGNNRLKLSVADNYIILSESDDIRTGDKNVNLERTESEGEQKNIVLEGSVSDRLTGEPIEGVVIVAAGTSKASVSNNEGEFILKLPDSLINSTIKISHIGYETSEYKISVLIDRHVKFALNPDVIPLQEVVVRFVEPAEVIRRMNEYRNKNYSLSPMYITAFYREGSDYKNRNAGLTEAVFKIYKPDYRKSTADEQVKLLKMRRISTARFDTITAKLQAGVNTCLSLDIMKDMPDFLSVGKGYLFSRSGVTVIDGRRINVISFKCKSCAEQPAYEGELYIDAENYALIAGDFQIDPDYIEQNPGLLIIKNRSKYKIELQKAAYRVFYRPVDGKYHISRIRGDLYFKTRPKKSIFGNQLHVWMDMINNEIDTINVVPFAGRARLSTKTVFSETRYVYDADFWENFNYVIPDEKFIKSLQTKEITVESDESEL